MGLLPPYLRQLEAESIHIMREVAAEFRNPVMLYSIGKDSSVMLHLALKAFYPGKPPFPLLHVDTTWKFREMIAFRDAEMRRLGLDLIVHINEQGVQRRHLAHHPWQRALYRHHEDARRSSRRSSEHGFDAAFGGARRDEEKSRAKERVFSFRNAAHAGTRSGSGPSCGISPTPRSAAASMRVFPLSNWTELDVWTYIYLEDIPVVPLYFAAERPVIERGGMLIMVDDERLPIDPGRDAHDAQVRFRTLGCYPLTGAIRVRGGDGAGDHRGAGGARAIPERQGRVIDHDQSGSMEKKKQEGYF